MSAPTKSQLASRHIRRLRTMRVQMMAMAEQWEELDQFCVNELEALADKVEEVAAGLVEDDGATSGRAA